MILINYCVYTQFYQETAKVDLMLYFGLPARQVNKSMSLASFADNQLNYFNNLALEGCLEIEEEITLAAII